MSDELDRRAALAMGWERINPDLNLYYDGNRTRGIGQNWSPSTDHNDLAELLREVERRNWNVQNSLNKKIADLWYADNNYNPRSEMLYIMTADPAVICLAAVEVLEANNG